MDFAVPDVEAVTGNTSAIPPGLLSCPDATVVLPISTDPGEVWTV
jgi:hypothetical protein